MTLLLALAACTGEEPTAPPIVVEPEPTERPWVDTGIFRPQDTAQVTLGDDVPANILSIEHTGYWERSGTPYDAFVGRLEVQERVNGYVPDTADTGDELDCDVGYFLTATPDPVPATCPGCGPMWLVTYTYDIDSVSPLSGCRDPELPHDGETWAMALNPAEGMIYFNYYGSGVWLPWWPAAETGDRVDFGWIGLLAIDLGEEDAT
ncbi:MAG: hypothetical protein KC621_12740 [Myxococcales bacterium]|nr:hypothetical protein [Myxococcales bacterium]